MNRAVSLLLFAGLAAASNAQTVTVTTAFDDVDIDWQNATIADLPGPDGKISFSEALIATNNTPGHQTIAFAVPQSEWTLQFMYAGRAVLRTSGGFFFRAFDEVTIDGTTQTAFTGDTNPDGCEITIFGGELYLNAGNSVFLGFDSVSVHLSGDNNTVQGCSGTTNISLFDARNNMIGGAGPGEGNHGSTIKIDRSDNNTVVGNTVQRVRVQGFVSDFGTGPATGNRIGGPTLGERNFITGYGTWNGEGYPGGTTLELFDTDSTIIENNWIGTTPDGMQAGSEASTQGIGFYGVNTGTEIRNNRIAGILGIGRGPHAQGLLFGQAIYLNGTGGDITITGNTIGLNANDEPVLGSVYGVYGENYLNIPLTGVSIGGVNPGEGNTIAGHLFSGIVLESPMHGIEISGNSIFANNQLGIDLGNNQATWYGVSPNDPLDADLGANALQNFPEIDSASASPAGTAVDGQLNSAPNGAYRVELFASPACDNSGHGEGQMFLGHFFAATDPLGVATFSEQVAGVAPAGWVVTATATDLSTGNTSEFSACTAVAAGCPADMTGEGILDLADIQAFIAGFTAQSPAADLTGDGIHDLADVQAFIASFTAGCP